MTLGTAAAGVVRAGGGTYNIGFNNGDETQFDAYDLAELLDLWIEFCAENNLQTNSVDYVERVENGRIADDENSKGVPEQGRFATR